VHVFRNSNGYGHYTLPPPFPRRDVFPTLDFFLLPLMICFSVFTLFFPPFMRGVNLAGSLTRPLFPPSCLLVFSSLFPGSFPAPIPFGQCRPKWVGFLPSMFLKNSFFSVADTRDVRLFKRHALPDIVISSVYVLIGGPTVPSQVRFSFHPWFALWSVYLCLFFFYESPSNTAFLVSKAAPVNFLVEVCLDGGAPPKNAPPCFLAGFVCEHRLPAAFFADRDTSPSFDFRFCLHAFRYPLPFLSPFDVSPVFVMFLSTPVKKQAALRLLSREFIPGCVRFAGPSISPLFFNSSLRLCQSIVSLPEILPNPSPETYRCF